MMWKNIIQPVVDDHIISTKVRTKTEHLKCVQHQREARDIDRDFNYIFVRAGPKYSNINLLGRHLLFYFSKSRIFLHMGLCLTEAVNITRSNVVRREENEV